MIGQDPMLATWLDRHCDFTVSGTLALDPVGMPRLVTSRSLDKQCNGLGVKINTKRECKIEAVQNEIDRITNTKTEDGEDVALQLNANLASLKKIGRNIR